MKRTLLNLLSWTALVLGLMPSPAFGAPPFQLLPGDAGIGPAAGIQQTPAIARGGDKLLVVWADGRGNGAGGSEYETASDNYGMRLNGLVPSGYGYAAASDGVNWVIVNQNTATGTDIMAMRISPTGVVLDPPTRVIVPGTYYQRSNFKLAYAAGVFLLTFDGAYVNGTYTTEFVRFDSNLTVLDATPGSLLPVSLGALAANDTGFYIAWNRQEPDYSVVVAGSRLSTAGLLLDGNGVNLSGAKQPYASSPTSVNWDGLNWRVTWGTYGTAWVARVSAAGVVLDPGSVATTLTQNGPTAGTGNGSVQMVWQSYVGADNDILTANIAHNNLAGPARTVSLGAPMQLRPDLTVTDAGYMLVYRSSVAAGSRVLAHPLDRAGNHLTADRSNSTAARTSPGLACPTSPGMERSASSPGAPAPAWSSSGCWPTAPRWTPHRISSPHRPSVRRT